MINEKRRIIYLLILICLIFIGLVVYLSYFQIFRAQDVRNHAYNKRLWINEENILRGSIWDRNGNILAYSQEQGENINRYYNYSNLYSHIVGYSYREYGKAGLEATYNSELLNLRELSGIEELINIVSPDIDGNNLELTIDHNLQERTRELLNGRKGSVIVMNPTSGEIYSMYSYPDFNTSNLREEWVSITESGDVLLNRASQGAYTPGSIFKIVTATALLESNVDLDYNCTGSAVIDGNTIADAGQIAHGQIDLEGAIINSCNSYFAEKSLEIDQNKFKEVAKRYMMDERIAFDLETNSSSFPKGNLNKNAIAEAAIGQGQVEVTPLNMALMVSAIANEGKMVKPYLVKRVEDSDGRFISLTETEILSNVMAPNMASELTEMMKSVVVRGTGRNANISNVQVAGKTGTAQITPRPSHSWFVGFAPADDPRIAVAVVLEESGTSGGQTAAPLARDLIIYGLNNINF